MRRRLSGVLTLLAALFTAAPASAAAPEWSVLGEMPATGHGVFRFPQALAPGR